jgi:hypothetical protein
MPKKLRGTFPRGTCSFCARRRRLIEMVTPPRPYWVVAFVNGEWKKYQVELSEAQLCPDHMIVMKLGECAESEPVQARFAAKGGVVTVALFPG